MSIPQSAQSHTGSPLFSHLLGALDKAADTGAAIGCFQVFVKQTNEGSMGLFVEFCVHPDLLLMIAMWKNPSMVV